MKKFHKSELDDICVTLANGKRFFNPHRSVFGLGNYDVNVLSVAVQSRGFEVSWHDARTDVKQVDLDQHFAIIANQRTAAKWYRFGQLHFEPSNLLFRIYMFRAQFRLVIKE